MNIVALHHRPPPPFLLFTTADHTPASLQRDLARLRGWDGQLDRMRSQHVQGCLFVDSKRLRAELEPITSSAAEQIKGLAQEVARTRCVAAREAFDARIKLLDARPVAASAAQPPTSTSSSSAGAANSGGTLSLQQLERYVSHAQHMTACREGESASAAESGAVEELYKLLQAYGARIAPEDAVGLDDLRNLTSAYGDAMRRARLWSEERRPGEW